jgi:hypothetical protein
MGWPRLRFPSLSLHRHACRVAVKFKSTRFALVSAPLDADSRTILQKTTAEAQIARLWLDDLLRASSSPVICDHDQRWNTHRLALVAAEIEGFVFRCDRCHKSATTP